MKEGLQQPLYHKLPSVPGRLERLFHVRPELISIAGHELNHVLVGYTFGFTGDISLKPEGDSLARATFQGSIPIGVFQIIAAAGAVNTPDAPAHGYGSDLSQVDIAEFFYRGVSRTEAISSAQSILSSYPKEVRQRAAEIIAFIGEVPSHMVSLILERAKEEISVETGNNYENFIVPEAESFDNVDSNGEQTIIENIGDFQKITYVKNNEVTKEVIICQACGGVNGHYPDCSVILLSTESVDRL